MVYFCRESEPGNSEDAGRSNLDKCLEEGGDTENET